MYTIAFPINTGDPGSTLSAQVVDLNGAPVGLQPTWVVVPGGGGFFGLYAANVDDSLNGGNYWIVVTDTNGGRVVDMRPTTFGLLPGEKKAFYAMHNGGNARGGKFYIVDDAGIESFEMDAQSGFITLNGLNYPVILGFRRADVPPTLPGGQLP